MAEHNDLGKAGENAAVVYLEQKGYLIRDRNWRRGHFELDIVAAKGNELIIVEVKTRSNTLFAEPEDAVDLPKIRRTVRAADAYIRLFQIDTPVRFDIITVVGDNRNFKVEHIEEAFYPPLY
ncbi:endonuclease [Bacteroides sp. HF-5092]|uniref:YraN family protein n=1 Tax=Bacteroides TaxID=816 RepID=UPI0011782BAD|nr:MULTISPECIES: YraN family protein [Bacteroides]TRX45960.1 endonuclease [Bacteroides sp. HF-5092]